MKKSLVLIWLLLLFSGITAFFWYNDWKFRQPTPVPSGYYAVALGASVQLPAAADTLLAASQGAHKPLFLHFFNPDCPCSRFNMPQFRALVQQYGDKLMDAGQRRAQLMRDVR